MHMVGLASQHRSTRLGTWGRQCSPEAPLVQEAMGALAVLEAKALAEGSEVGAKQEA